MNLPPLNEKRIEVCGSTARFWTSDEGWVLAQSAAEVFSWTFKDEFRIRWAINHSVWLEGGGTIIGKAPLTEEEFLRIAIGLLEKVYESQNQ